MLISSLISGKLLVSALAAKDMVNLDVAKRVTSNLLYAGRQFILNSVQNDKSEEQKEAQAAPRSTEYLVHNWLEALFAWFQMVILWHDPFVSIGAISGLLSTYLLLTYFAPRFYATIMITIFVYNLTKVWFRHVWPEIRVPPEEGRDEESRLDVDRWTYLHPQIMTLAEFRQATSNLFTATYIGNTISGSSLIFCTATALVLAPGIYLHLIPKSAKDYLKDKINSRIQSQGSRALYEAEPSTSSSLSLSLSSTATSPSPPPSPLVPPSLSSAPSSFYHHLRRRSFIARLEPTPETNESSPRSETDSTTCVPTNDDGGENQPQEAKSKQIVQLETQDVDNNGSRHHRHHDDQLICKSSADQSSNGSTSLIDSEEDQYDGFVLL